MKEYFDKETLLCFIDTLINEAKNDLEYVTTTSSLNRIMCQVQIAEREMFKDYISHFSTIKIDMPEDDDSMCLDCGEYNRNCFND